jgi:hypothetical protein
MKCSEWQSKIIKSDSKEPDNKGKDKIDVHISECKECKVFNESLNLASYVFASDEISYNEDVYGKIKDKLDSSLFEDKVSSENKILNLNNNLKLILTSLATVIVVVSVMGVLYNKDNSMSVNNESKSSEVFDEYQSDSDVAQSEDQEYESENEAYEAYNFNVFEDLEKYGDIYYDENEIYDISDETFGGLKLGMDTTEVKEVLGNPNSFNEVSSNSDNKYRMWYYDDNSIVLQFSVNSESKLILNKIVANKLCEFATKSGIKIGDSLDDLIDIYKGKILKPNDDFKSEEFVAIGDYEKGVILFSVFNDKINNITYSNKYSID